MCSRPPSLSLSARPGSGQPRGHQRRVEAFGVRMGGQLLEILPQERLTAREPELQHAERAGLGKYPLPVVGRELALGPNQIERIGAIGAVQRTPMGQLRQQGGRGCQPARISSRSAMATGIRVTSVLTST